MIDYVNCIFNYVFWQLCYSKHSLYHELGCQLFVYILWRYFTVLYLGVSLISQFCRFDIQYNFYWYSEYIDIHFIVIIDKPCMITSFIFSMDFPVQTPCPNRHNYRTKQLIKMFLLTELCATSVHISTLFLNMST